MNSNPRDGATAPTWCAATHVTAPSATNSGRRCAEHSGWSAAPRRTTIPGSLRRQRRGRLLDRRRRWTQAPSLTAPVHQNV